MCFTTCHQLVTSLTPINVFLTHNRLRMIVKYTLGSLYRSYIWTIDIKEGDKIQNYLKQGPLLSPNGKLFTHNVRKASSVLSHEAQISKSLHQYE